MLKYINGEMPPETKELINYSDGCAGQQKNSIFCSAFLHASKNTNLEKINHIFFEKGHSQSEVDSIHARIEKHSKHLTVFDKQSWVKLVENSKETEPVYSVKELEHEDILNVTDLAKAVLPNQLYVETPTENGQEKEKLVWNDVHCIEYTKENSEKIRVKYDIREDYRNVAICKKPRNPSRISTQRTSISGYKFKKKYPRKLGIAKEKKKDLVKLCEKQLIPSCYHSFYVSLPTNETEIDSSCTSTCSCDNCTE